MIGATDILIHFGYSYDPLSCVSASFLCTNKCLKSSGRVMTHCLLCLHPIGPYHNNIRLIGLRPEISPIGLELRPVPPLLIFLLLVHIFNVVNYTNKSLTKFDHS